MNHWFIVLSVMSVSDMDPVANSHGISIRCSAYEPQVFRSQLVMDTGWIHYRFILNRVLYKIKYILGIKNHNLLSYNNPGPTQGIHLRVTM